MKLFTKTYTKDLPWFELAISSVMRRAQESVDWTIVCDNGEKGAVKDVFDRANIRLNAKSNLLLFEVGDKWPEAASMGSGYIQQQWIKMTSHRVMGDDYFLNWDSDVIALRPFDSMSFKNSMGKPILWFTPFNDLIQGGDQAVHEARRAYIQNIFQIAEAPFEWMRCMPLWMNGGILRVAEGRPEWNRTMNLLKTGNVHGMSEFNLIGQMSNTYFPDAYDYKNTQNSCPTWSGPIDSHIAIVHQSWSWGNIPDQFRDVALGVL